ncbi:S8 family serine peptidase [Phyllobacterium sp. SYP-B3895]|uniref:S8 family serine peptidase n=1 Tax=Phyllobacterium sp. SYP-B3895 TaxID=2663240 RepID=UPI001299A56C|nr:S8 family serine peptidase [Phyllobacterium sp. SYP-B3895]MRG58161.1 S8 family serine peptidase [Phyllobacterium sp. SYP-B3895]
MVEAAKQRRILVKTTAAIGGQRLTFGAAGAEFSVEPLFRSIGQQHGLGIAGAAAWHVLSTDDDSGNPWDLCHSMVTGGLGIAGTAVEFAEPDLTQRWLIGDEKSIGIGLTASCDRAAPQNASYPRDPDNFWLRKRSHSQFDDALAEVGTPSAAGRVRVAHLDTGYDPRHGSFPAHMNLALQRNFVDANRPNDATDTTGEAALSNPGHGTGTLGILAGKAFGTTPVIGCAPNVDVVPLRVANSVVLFSNSSIARAFDYVHALCNNPATRVHVITMSMGGLASQAWADAVNALYERGVFIVTAAGNNYANLPTRNIVYPARFNRVVAACGVMADHMPYADLPAAVMAGNYGPASKMTTAIAACTPNTTWARKGCPAIIDFDGNGTSSATPQVAASAALWIQKNMTKYTAYREDWMRVEAVRKALFQTADARGDLRRLGRGELKALAALSVAPARAADLAKQPSDSASFPFLNVLTGGQFGLADGDNPGRRMLELEALQLSQSAEVEAALPDPSVDPQTLTAKQRLDIADALLAQPAISQRLRQTLMAAVPTAVPAIALPQADDAVTKFHLKSAMSPDITAPSRRRLHVFALDPSLATSIETAAINEAVLDVRWERGLLPGPIGEYLEIVDIDPASRCAYAPVDLNHVHLLPQDGLAPSEGNPQFHQQMTYAVAMRTIEFFELALGRSALWAPRIVTVTDKVRREFVQRLRIYPHGIRARNAYYSPERKALLFGYFTASGPTAGLGLPHGVVFTALSHDVIAHETTHALLDGLHSRFREPTNPDVLAFHEAFADIVALFQHFAMPEALRHQISRTRGDLSQENLLSELAIEFGQALSGGYGALRDAIGSRDADGKWVARKPKPTDYGASKEPHALGAVLVSAIFAAFLAIYKARMLDLVKLATQGTGVLPPGDISVELADRMADEASKVATQVLKMCIRALDYCPPVDITFGDYLRALITADRDLVPDDPRGYRVAFVAAFRDRGIYPSGVRHLSPGNLIWESPPLPLTNLDAILSEMKLTWNLNNDRRLAYKASQLNAATFHAWLVSPKQVSDEELAMLGFTRKSQKMRVGNMEGQMRGLEVHSVRPARRIGPDGQSRTDLIVEITQTFRPDQVLDGLYRGGCTLVIDLETSTVRYCIRKRVTSAERMSQQAAYRRQFESDPRMQYFDQSPAGDEPFAMLHRSGH